MVSVTAVDNRDNETSDDDTERPHGRPGRPGIGIVFAAVVGALLPQLWFRAGTFIAAGDNGPFLGGLDDLGRSWTTSLTGTGSSGYVATGALENLLHWAVVSIGFGSPDAQRLWYTIVVASAAASAAWFAGQFTRHWAATLTAGVVAVANPFHIITLPNVLPLVTVTAVCVIGAATTRIARGTKAPWWTPLALSATMAIVVRNPPLLVLCAAVAVIGAGVALLARKPHMAGHVAALSGVTFLCSLFWIVPVALHFGLGTPGIEVVATTNVDSWSWTQRHSGPTNVISLVATWVWGDPDVLSSTAALSQPWWSYLRFGLPVVAFGSLFVAVHRKTAAWFAGTASVLVVLSVGVNAPFGAFNNFLVNNIPGFWLYRQPMSKFGVLLVVCYCVLTALTVDGLVARWQRRPVERHTRTITAVFAVAGMAAVIYPYPLYTGTVIPGDRVYLPSGQVKVPAAFDEVGDWLEGADGDGAVLVLPLSEYYQRGTTWGYYGVDDLISRVTTRPAFFILPGGYYEAAGTSGNLMAAAQTALELGDMETWENTIAALGVRYVAVRTDFELNWGLNRSWTSGSKLKSQADKNLDLAAEFEFISVYDAVGDRSSTVTQALQTVPGATRQNIADVVSSSDGAVVLTGNNEGTADSFAWRAERSQDTYVNDAATNATNVRVFPHTAPIWELEAHGGNYRTRPSGGINVGDDELRFEWQDTGLNDNAAAFLIDGWPMRADQDVYYTAAPGTTITALTATSSATQLNACEQQAADCRSFPLPVTASVEGVRTWLLDIELADENVEGVACVWSIPDEACTSGSSLPILDDTLPGIVAVESGADGPFEYRVQSGDITSGNISGSVTGLEEGERTTVGDIGDITRTTERGPVTMVATGTMYERNRIDGFQDTVSDCHNYDDGPAADNALSVSVKDGVVELSARRHSACVNSAIDVAVGAENMTLSFDYVNTEGSGARWCVLAPQGDGCLASGGLPVSDDWQNFEQQVTLPGPQVGQIGSTAPPRLYLYADGAGPGESARTSTVQYRNIAVHATFPYAVTATAEPETAHTYLIYRTGFAEGWQARGVDGTHFVADGWSNGWQLTGEWDPDSGFVYRWDRYTAMAALISLLSIAGVVAAATVRRIRPVRNPEGDI